MIIIIIIAIGYKARTETFSVRSVFNTPVIYRVRASGTRFLLKTSIRVTHYTSFYFCNNNSIFSKDFITIGPTLLLYLSYSDYLLLRLAIFCIQHKESYTIAHNCVRY